VIEFSLRRRRCQNDLLPPFVDVREQVVSLRERLCLIQELGFEDRVMRFAQSFLRFLIKVG
jgi:hypothetical protein